MSAQKTSQYQAYSLATRTVAKTRQVVMLYDGAIRFIKQAKEAIAENRIEDRFKLLLKASDIIVGLQSSIDFENGGEVAHTLHRFYTQISTRILSVNFDRDGEKVCDTLIDDLKQMRDVWSTIDSTVTQGESSSPTDTDTPATGSAIAGGITLSA